MTAMDVDGVGEGPPAATDPVHPDESIESVIPLLNSPMNKGDYWYLVDKKWFETFKSFIKDMDPALNPGPIDNSPLFKNADSKDTVLELRERLQEDLDFVFVPERGWEMLVNEFSIVSENHVIRRVVIEQGHFSAYTIVEVYPIELKLCIYGSKAEIITKSFSRVTPFRELVSEIKRMHGIDPDREIQIWSNGSVLNPHSLSTHSSTSASSSATSASFSPSSSSSATSTSSIPPPPPFPPASSATAAGPSSSPTPSSATLSTAKNSDNMTLTDLGLHTGSVVTMELKNADGTWPSSRPKYGSVATRSSKCTPGLCGLMNLGNTCFMNSALQCMSNTTYLTDFFLSDTHLKEINTENPLGMGGQIARTYGDLIKSMWSGAHSCQAPREFKLAVGRFAPQFSGFQQQDCQELMAFLLDGLHEDLNRITQKPYIEISTEIDKRPDEVVAAESWANYKKRNDSIIVDTFHGLLKSTLVCPDCALVSVTFDPFCYLSLPLPVKRERAIDMTFVPAGLTSATVAETTENGNEEVQMIKLSKLMIPKVGTISEICNVTARAINDNCKDQGYSVDPERLIVAEVCNHRFHKLFGNDDSYCPQLDSIVVFETQEDKIPIPVYLREDKGNDQTQLFGMPTFVNVDEVTYDQLYSAILSYVKRLFRMTDDSQDDAQMRTEGEAAAEEEDMDADEGVAELDDEIFTLTLVNSYGSLSQEKLERGKPIKVTNKMYVAADFTTKWRKRYCEDREHSMCRKIVAGKSLTSRATINLSDCMNQFTTTEKLGADDPWFCPRCKKHQEATKKFDLWDLPKVLIIHLKRFSYSRFWRDKLDVLVSFPIQGLDMSSYVINSSASQDKLYDLVAVANHYGGLGGGHYTAYGKNRETRQWHYFDDSNVSNATEENVVSKGAYVLFYQRRE